MFLAAEVLQPVCLSCNYKHICETKGKEVGDSEVKLSPLRSSVNFR